LPRPRDSNRNNTEPLRASPPPASRRPPGSCNGIWTAHSSLSCRPPECARCGEASSAEAPMMLTLAAHRLAPCARRQARQGNDADGAQVRARERVARTRRQPVGEHTLRGPSIRLQEKAFGDWRAWCGVYSPPCSKGVTSLGVTVGRVLSWTVHQDRMESSVQSARNGGPCVAYSSRCDDPDPPVRLRHATCDICVARCFDVREPWRPGTPRSTRSDLFRELEDQPKRLLCAAPAGSWKLRCIKSVLDSRLRLSTQYTQSGEPETAPSGTKEKGLGLGSRSPKGVGVGCNLRTLGSHDAN
jgi:hypothetical protein